MFKEAAGVGIAAAEFGANSQEIQRPRQEQAAVGALGGRQLGPDGFGRGRVASIQANHLLTGRARVVVIKTRVVRHGGRGAPLGLHLGYLRREGVTRDGEKARLFGPGTEDADPRAFAERCAGDRHHFRFIVSPEDATEMADLRGFTRELVGRMEADLGTRLDWVAVDHWNTDNPHIHLLVRGTADDGQDLVISRDYIRGGMRARARDLVTLELGPRTDHDIHRTLERQVEAERWTDLDRQLVRDGRASGVIDMAPEPGRQPDALHVLKVGRLRKLEALGLADPVGPGQWVIDDGAEATAPLGLAVIGGLTAATVATLTVLPSVYSLVQQSAHTTSPSLDPDDPDSAFALS